MDRGRARASNSWMPHPSTGGLVADGKPADAAGLP